MANFGDPYPMERCYIHPLEMFAVPVQLPRYECHKQVRALKIREVNLIPTPDFKVAVCRGSYALGSACNHCERCDWEREHPAPHGRVIVPADAQYAPFLVSAEYIRKHNPQAGGYYVVYEDGYQSFSPAAAFEAGYSPIP